MVDFSRYDGGDDEWRAVLAATPRPEYDPPLSSPIERKNLHNKRAEAASAAAMVSLADKVKIQRFTFTARDGAPLEARSYRPATAGDDERLPVFYYIHGGGFLTGNLDVDEATCSEFALGANVVVVHANYRHTPEFTFPTAWEDAEDAFVWFHEHIDEMGGIPESVVVGGISAGAQLAAFLVLHHSLGKLAPGSPRIAGQLLMVPVLSHVDLRLASIAGSEHAHLSSYESNKNADMLSVAEIKGIAELLKIPNPDPRDLRYSLINATPEEVAGLPPTTIAVSGLDILRDDGLEYGKLLTEAGVPTQIHVFRGMPHFFRGFGDKISQSKRWDAIIHDGIRWPLSKPPATGQFIIRED